MLKLIGSADSDDALPPPIILLHGSAIARLLGGVIDEALDGHAALAIAREMDAFYRRRAARFQP
jgi:hypothetical protein